MNPESQVTVLGRGRFVQLEKKGRWEYARRIGCESVVVIVPVTDDDKIVLVEQFRIPIGRRVIELPAGLVGECSEAPDEDYAQAASRELIEETGYRAERFTYLTHGPTSAGLCSEVVTFCRAEGLTRVGRGGGIDDEEITIHEVPIAQAADWLARVATDTMLVDPKVYVGLHFIQSHPPG
ncbi:MAG: NUDIX hydrolase [bacterium]|nr:NUDIX hydrolase [bacterium]